MDPDHPATTSPSCACARASCRAARGKAGAHRQRADEPFRTTVLFSPVRASCRRNLCGRHWSGIPNHGTLRIGDTLTEGEGYPCSRHAELRAGNPAPRSPRRCDEAKSFARSACRWRKRRRAALPAR